MHPRKSASRNGGQLLTDTLFVEKNFAKLCLGWVGKVPVLGGKEMQGPDRKGTDTAAKALCSLSGAPKTAAQVTRSWVLVQLSKGFPSLGRLDNKART